MERIVAAAIHWPGTGLTISTDQPGRHSDALLAFLETAIGLGLTTTDGVFSPTSDRMSEHVKTVQGFITSEGRFVDRYEGWDIASTSGQPRAGGLTWEDLPDTTGWLTSEDVW